MSQVEAPDNVVVDGCWNPLKKKPSGSTRAQHFRLSLERARISANHEFSAMRSFLCSSLFATSMLLSHSLMEHDVDFVFWSGNALRLSSMVFDRDETM